MLKTVSSIVNAIGALNYKGTWNASTNSPALASGVGTKGDYYVVSVAGATNLDGETLWGVGDWAVYNGAAWQRLEGGSTINATTVTAVDITTTGNTILGNAATDTLNVGNGDLIKDASGNLGLGVTPSAWQSSSQSLDMYGSGSLYSNNSSNDVRLALNTYVNSGGFNTYKTTNFATIYKQNSGQHIWETAASGTAGNSITFTQAMTLDANGSLTVNCSSAVANALVVQRNGGTDTNTVMQFKGATTSYYIGRKTDGSLGFAYNTSDVTGSSLMTLSTTGIVTMSAYGAGAATFSAAGVISSVSDETWKTKDGIPLNPDAMLQKLEPGYWYYNEEKAPIFGADRQLGFYAQNVNYAIGVEAAPVPEEGKPWGYYDRSVLAVTVMSLQKALATIESLTARLEKLEGK